jgi:hypothetical protein
MNNTIVRFGIAAAAVVIAAILVIRFLPAGNVGGEAEATPKPSPPPTPTSTPSQSADSPAVESPIVSGWPGVWENPPGQYSWQQGDRGWMHKIAGNSVGVIITFSPSANAYESGPTAVTVAGYDATYQELPVGADGVRKQVWIVDIDETRFTITIESPPSTSAANLAEAEAIVDSIRHEPTETGARFMLTFTLPAGWDSG